MKIKIIKSIPGEGWEPIHHMIGRTYEVSYADGNDTGEIKLSCGAYLQKGEYEIIDETQKSIVTFSLPVGAVEVLKALGLILRD